MRVLLLGQLLGLSGAELVNLRQGSASPDVSFVGVFSFTPDPQRSTVYEPDDADHIEAWRRSVARLGLNGVVLHDDAYSDGFGAEGVQMHRVNLTASGLFSDPRITNLTSADFRFIAFHDYLKRNPHLEYVLLTDSHDIEFRKDPFKLMRAMDQAMGHEYIYGQEEWRPRVSLDVKTNPEETAMSRLTGYYQACFGEPMPEAYTMGRMPNCAILGGHVSVVVPFLERMRHWYAKVPQNKRFMMCDMLVYMRTVMEDYNDHFVSGYPFHAKFKQDSDELEYAAIYHKAPVPGVDGVDWELLRSPAAKVADLPEEMAWEVKPDGGFQPAGGMEQELWKLAHTNPKVQQDLEQIDRWKLRRPEAERRKAVETELVHEARQVLPWAKRP